MNGVERRKPRSRVKPSTRKERITGEGRPYGADPKKPTTIDCETANDDGDRPEGRSQRVKNT